MIALADSSTRLLIGPKDTHRFGVVERSAFILPAADGHSADPFALGVFRRRELISFHSLWGMMSKRTRASAHEVF